MCLFFRVRYENCPHEDTVYIPYCNVTGLCNDKDKCEEPIDVYKYAKWNSPFCLRPVTRTHADKCRRTSCKGLNADFPQTYAPYIPKELVKPAAQDIFRLKRYIHSEKVTSRRQVDDLNSKPGGVEGGYDEGYRLGRQLTEEGFIPTIRLPGHQQHNTQTSSQTSNPSLSQNPGPVTSPAQQTLTNYASAFLLKDADYRSNSGSVLSSGQQTSTGYTQTSPQRSTSNVAFPSASSSKATTVTVANARLSVTKPVQNDPLTGKPSKRTYRESLIAAQEQTKQNKKEEPSHHSIHEKSPTSMRSSAQQSTLRHAHSSQQQDSAETHNNPLKRTFGERAASSSGSSTPTGNRRHEDQRPRLENSQIGQSSNDPGFQQGQAEGEEWQEFLDWQE